MNRFTRVLLRIFLWFLGATIALILLVVFLIRLPSIQNLLVGKATQYIENKIGTAVHIGYVNITFPKKIVLEDIYFEDQSKDTLLAGEKLLLDISMFKLLKNTVEIQEIDLQGITAKINRSIPDGQFNFDYILNAFSTQPEDNTKKPDSTAALVFNIDKVNLDRIHLAYHDELIGTSATLWLHHFDTRIKTFDLNANMTFDMPKINLDGLTAHVKQWAVTNIDTVDQIEVNSNSTSSLALLPNLATEDIQLKDIFVRYQDQTSAIDSKFDIKKITAHVELIDLNNEIVKLRELSLGQSDSYVTLGKTTKSTSTAPTNSSPINWIVSAEDLRIDNTNLAFKDDNQQRMKGFDYFNIKITDLTGQLNKLYYSADSISGSLKSLSAKDHSGFHLKRLHTDFKYSSTGATLDNLLAETSHSTIRDYLKLSYPSLDVLTENPGLIQIEAKVKKTQLDMADIRLFVPDLEQIDAMKPLLTKRFYIDGHVVGKLNDLHIPSFQFRTLDNTQMIAQADIKGLPDMEKVYINLDLKKLTTSKLDLDRLVDKSLLPKDMAVQFPNSISLAGTFNGGMNGFKTNMSLLTEKGNASINGSLAMAGKDTTYNASLSISDLNIGHILDQDSILGIFSMDATVQGKGLDPKTMDANISGRLNRLDAMGYQYEDISMNVSAQNGSIVGQANANDPNISFGLDMEANMQGQYPQLKAQLMIDSVNLKNLKLLDENFRYHGKVDLNLATADINHLNGKLAISQSSIAFNEDRYTLDTIAMIAMADSNRNTLILNSEFIKAHLVGKYKLTELSSSIQDVARVYYNPTNEKPTTLAYEDQNFEFSASINNSRFIRDFLPGLERMDDITLDGTFNSQQKSIMAKLIAPILIYDGIEVKDVGVDIITVDSTLYYSTLINKIKVNNIELNNTVLSGKAFENNIDFGLWIKDKNQKDRYHLGAKMSVDESNYMLSLFEDGLMLNYDKWNIAPSNQLTFGKNGLSATDFKLTFQNQALSIQSQDSVQHAPVDLLFNNFRIETFSKMLESEILNFGGGINGSATISRLEANPVFVSDIAIEKFYFGKDTVGNILIKVDNLKENTFAVNVEITENGNNVQLLGEYVVPSSGVPVFNATLELKPLKMKTIEAFSLGYIKNSAGDINGLLHISGDLSSPKILGDLTFNKAKMNISMLNADLLVDNQKVFFNEKGISFKQFELNDHRGNQARLNGSISTVDYDHINFNLNLSANDFAVVNSTRADNDLFYGKLNITSDLRIKGDIHRPQIDGSIRANQNTDFVIIVPNDNPGVAERDGVVKFVNKSDTARHNVFAKLDSLTHATELSGIDLALNLSTDREAKFKVIIDEGSQDALNIQGVAELATAIDASNKITMSGTFTVEKGNYSFNFGPIRKEFDFEKGSTITWNGDPLDARMNITALYKGRFPTLELVSNQIGTESPNLYKQRVPFDVKLILAGELFKPDLKFDIDLDENNAIISQDVASKVNIGLTALRDDPAELNKQVFSLIIMGRFMSSNPFESLSGGGGVEGIARSSVSSFLTSQLNNLASDLIKGVELDFNLQSEQDYLTGSAQNRTDLNVGISKMLFDDRLKITVGSNFEVEGNTRPGEKPNNIAGDISIDYQLSKDGRYFARVYRKNQYQATLQGQFVETGIGFIINMSFNEFKELFMSSKALEQYYNSNSSNFKKRFNVNRLETDSIYRDSVRTVIRDSLMLHSPRFRKRMEEQENEEKLQKSQDSVQNNTGKPYNEVLKEKQLTAIRNEEEERKTYAY